LGLLAAVVLYNWTEAAFGTYNPIWFAFYLIALDYPRTDLTTAQSTIGVAGPEESSEFAYAKEEP
jgi:hypothetical protein